eukprot:4124977-Lingulodinium_polyedra.AAC.1
MGIVAPARRSKTALNGGGVTAGARSYLACSTFRHLARLEEQSVGMGRPTGEAFSPGPIDLWDIAAYSVEWGLGTLVVAFGWLTASLGIRGDNLTKLANWAGLLRSIQGPWIVCADWNATPEEIIDSGWTEQMEAKVIRPANTGWTCAN